MRMYNEQLRFRSIDVIEYNIIITLIHIITVILYLSSISSLIHCKNKIVKITNLLVSTVTRNSGNCNLIGCVGYDYMVDIHVIII